MTDHSPTDLTDPSYAELLAKIALLEQQQKQQQDAYQQRLQEQQQQYEKQLKAYQGKHPTIPYCGDCQT